MKGLNAFLATASTPSSAPVIVATRLRKGSANSARGAARLVADALVTTSRCGVTGLVVLRADSAFYGRDVIAAARRAGARFSITARKDRAVTAAIDSIPDDAWTTIRYPKAVFDEELGQWVSDAEVAEIGFTAFTSRRKADQVTARLIVRRVRDANPEHVVANAQGELFPVWRHHAVFTDSPRPMLAAEADHRRHAIIEQVIADLKNGPLDAPALGFLRGELRVAGAGRDGVQPHPRRRRARRPVPRQSRHRDHPHTPDHRRRPGHPLRPPRHPATTDPLALGDHLAATVHRGDRPTTSDLTTDHRPCGPEPETASVDKPGPAGTLNAATATEHHHQDQLRPIKINGGASGLNTTTADRDRI